MAIKGIHDDAQSSNNIEIESDRQQRMKRKINEYDGAIDNCRTKAAKVCDKMMGSSVCSYVNGSNPLDYNEKFVEEGFSNMENSHLPVKIMYSEKRETREEEIEMMKRREELVARERALVAFVKKKQGIKPRAQQNRRIDDLSMCLDQPYLIFQELEVKDMEDLREDIKVYLYLDRAKPTRTRFWEAFLVVCDWELAEARKKQALDRARVHPLAELIGEERELDSSAQGKSYNELEVLQSEIEADIKNLLEGKSYNELEVLQSEIESQMRSGSANEVEYWEPILKHVQVYKAKAFLKEECRVKILRMNVEKGQEVDANYDGNNDQTGTEGAEGTGSSSSPELLFGEGTGDNFEMKATGVMEGVMEEGDALSGTNDKVNLQSPVYWPINKCCSKKPKYFNRVLIEGEGYNYNHQILLSG